MRRWNASSYEQLGIEYVSPSFLSGLAACGRSRIAISDRDGRSTVLDFSRSNAAATLDIAHGQVGTKVVAIANTGEASSWWVAIEADQGMSGRLERWSFTAAGRKLLDLPGLPWAVAQLPDRAGIAVATRGDRGRNDLLTVSETGQVRPPISLGMTGRPSFSRDGRWLVAPAFKGVENGNPAFVMRVWDVIAGRPAVDLPGGSLGIFLGTGAFTSDDRGVAVITQAAPTHYRAAIFGRTTGAPIASFADSVVPLLSVALSTDDTRLVTTNMYGTVTVWDVASRAPIAQLFGHAGPVWSAVFSSDGKQLATAGDDGTARLWDLTTGAQLAAYSGHAGTIWAARFSADGRQLITGGLDGTLRAYPTRPADILALACDRLRGDPTDEARLCR